MKAHLARTFVYQFQPKMAINYHEVASLHVRIITKRASNSRNVPGGGGGGGGGNKHILV